MRHSLMRKGLCVLASGLAVLLVGPFLIPIPPLKGTFPPRSLADDDSEFIKISGLDIHVKKIGQSQPVFLLLHGFAASLYTWHAVMEAFSRLGTVIAYDRPGFGLSERPLNWQGRNPYSAEAQVDTLIGLLDHFGVQKAILVGNSAGGTIAMQTALTHPERVSGMILVDPAVYIGNHAPRWLHTLFNTPQIRHLGPLFARQILRFGQALIERAWHDPSLLPTEMLEFYRKPFQVENWDRALWEFTRTSRRISLADRLGEFTLPVLVITGDDDRIIPTQDSIRLAGELPNAILAVINQAGHIPHEEKPQVFMGEVNKFLQAVYP